MKAKELKWRKYGKMVDGKGFMFDCTIHYDGEAQISMIQPNGTFRTTWYNNHHTPQEEWKDETLPKIKEGIQRIFEEHLDNINKNLQEWIV